MVTLFAVPLNLYPYLPFLSFQGGVGSWEQQFPVGGGDFDRAGVARFIPFPFRVGTLFVQELEFFDSVFNIL